MTEINLNVFRAAGHRLVDRIVDEFEELIREGLPAVALPPVANPPIRFEPETKDGTPLDDPEPSSRPQAQSVRSTLSPAVTMAVRAYQQGATQLEISVPVVIAERSGLVVGRRVRVTIYEDSLEVTAADRGVKVVRNSGIAVHVRAGGAQYGLRKAHGSTRCTSHLDLDDRLVVDLPRWWPKGKPATEGPSGRARRAAPEAPPVPAKIEDAPSRKTAIAHHRVSPAAPWKGEAIDGGELIPEANREFHCNTCAAKIATVTCDTCDGLFCPGCWSSHLLTHRRPGAAARREEVAHA